MCYDWLFQPVTLYTTGDYVRTHNVITALMNCFILDVLHRNNTTYKHLGDFQRVLINKLICTLGGVVPKRVMKDMHVPVNIIHPDQVLISCATLDFSAINAENDNTPVSSVYVASL